MVSDDCVGRGSSPPARGPPVHGARACRKRGLIPACAGTTWARHRRSSSRRAHPRLRGDHAPDGEKQGVLRGSSPPARGPPGCTAKIRCRLGLIPACAGTTCLATASVSSPKAHPRLRGDHTLSGIMRYSPRGSSPPARGPRQRIILESGGERLIPACAGTTSARGESMSEARAHPRLRGDH